MTEVEAFKNLTSNFSGLAVDDKFRCKALELFSGCSLLSTFCRRKGMSAISVDNDPDSNATMKVDFTDRNIRSDLLSIAHDYIHASPVCRTYSYLSGGCHRSKDNYNLSGDSHEADGMLLELYFFIEQALRNNNDATITIENPRGKMQHSNIMKELFESKLDFKKYEIFYCQFGRGDMKPTHIWTNDAKLGQLLKIEGGKCTCGKLHEEGVRSSPGKNFAALPMALCELLSTYVHSKHTQIKFDKRIASNNGSASCDASTR